MALLMAIAFTALFALMAILNPKTLLNRLAMWFCFCCTLIMWRTIAALFKPEVFGVRESLVASVVFAVATIVTTAFGVVAWYEHIGDYLNHRKNSKKTWRN